MTNPTNTATVVTLTAEVRVMQVNNRQITLSVVKQLDRARYEDIDPMGRVRSGRKIDYVYYPELGEQKIEIVGRLRATGALVIAFAPKANLPEPPTEWWHWSGHRVLSGELSVGKHHRVAEIDGKTLTWGASTHDELSWCCPMFKKANPYRYWARDIDDLEKWLHEEWAYRVKCGEFCDMAAFEQQWRTDANDLYTDYLARKKLAAEAEELPLIVLAGLR